MSLIPTKDLLQRVLIRKNPNAFIEQLKRRKKRFMVRNTPFICEIISEGVRYLFIKPEGYSPQDVHIFKVVKYDAINFLKEHPDFKPQDQYKSNLMNYEYDDTIGILTGTDLNSAYWTIAAQMGIISQKTFEKYSDARYKTIRLSALAILGRKKAYSSHYGQSEVGKMIVEDENTMLKEVYRSVRFECYRHMATLAEMLGDEFESYKTDCIYYRDTPENRKLVHDYFTDNNLQFKQYIFGEED